MKYLLIDADRTGHPNLALMKLSSRLKGLGHTVGLLGNSHAPLAPDYAYISCVFPKNSSYALGVSKMLNCPVEIGGSGIDFSTILPGDVEHCKPDYSLYNIEYSIGFSSRGCDRNCPWCIVWKKEGVIREHAPIEEFYVPLWGKLRLYDNNFLRSPNRITKLQTLKEEKIKVDFNQGLDIREVDQEVAHLLAQIHYADTHFKEPRLRFSFDFAELESDFLRGHGNLLKAGIKKHHLFIYILGGFKKKGQEAFDDLYYRVKQVIALGAFPFVQLYNNEGDEQLKNLQRWCLYRLFKIIPFEKYDRHYRRKDHAGS